MKNTKLQIVLAAVIGAALALAAIALPRLLRQETGLWGGPMVQLLQSDSFSLVWRVDAAGPQAVQVPQVVHVKDEAGHYREFSSTCDAGWYRADITGLKPATFYQYVILSTPYRPDELPHVIGCGRTRTAPLPGGPFRFIAFGDSAADRPEQTLVAKLASLYDPDLLIHLGDVMHLDGSLSRYPAWFFKPYVNLLPRTCVYPCMGNHDWDDTAGEPFFRVFALPENGPKGVHPKRHYWFDFGDVRFIALDSNDSFDSIRTNMAPWLESVLAQAGDRWKIVYFHHPLYTDGGNRPRGAFHEYIRPLLDRFNVDVVMSGHNHLYERSYPLRDGKPVASGPGTVYITAGIGGASLRQFESPDMLDFQATRNDKQNGFLVVDVTPEALSFRQIGQINNVLDRFVIHRPAAAPTTVSAVAGAASRPAVAEEPSGVHD